MLAEVVRDDQDVLRATRGGVVSGDRFPQKLKNEAFV